MKYADQDHKRKRLEQHDQLLQDQLDNRSRLQSTETNPREGLPRTELSLPSERDHVDPFHNIPSPMALWRDADLMASLRELDLGNYPIVHSGSRSEGSDSVSSQYLCTFEGCKAPPFQTQYLLNSHAQIHSQARPHYCPRRGCPRSEGGKGFKRKNEMIRHILVHNSPGDECPFCPDREHKYPRPENLQR